MPPKGKASAIELPQAIADEIADAAQKTHRSTAFIIARALAAGKGAPAVPLSAPMSHLPITSDDDGNELVDCADPACFNDSFCTSTDTAQTGDDGDG